MRHSRVKVAVALAPALLTAVLNAILPLPAVGAVVAWGANTYGQTNGMPGLANIVAIAAGGDHNVALQADGKVVGWGLNNYGQASVPLGLSNVLAVAAGLYHSVALKADHTVLVWGDDRYGQTEAPVGLTNVVAIAAGGYHNLALRDDGTVVAWGYDGYGQRDVPTNLTGVVAIAAGREHSLALKADGTVVFWGFNDSGFVNLPTGLTNIVAIAAGGYHSLALKADGTVTAWGDNSVGQVAVPTGLKDVVAIAAGGYHSLALRSDGTVIAWGANDSGQTSVPANLGGIVAIAGGNRHNLALVGEGPPFATTFLVDRVVFGGKIVYFRMAATGAAPLDYRWQFNGVELPGANLAVLALTNVQLVQAGTYSVTVSNRFGISRAMAQLRVIPLRIAVQPLTQTVIPGEAASFTIAAEGSEPFSYQWKYNGAELLGAAEAVLTLTNIQMVQAGTYSVTVSNRYGMVQSENATLQVLPVHIVTQPQSQVVILGTTATLDVSVAGKDPLGFQWQLNGKALEGATNRTLVLSNAQINQSGTYAVLISNVFGTLKSAEANLTVSSIVVWGDNSFGQFTQAPPVSNQVVAVAAGFAHLMALQADGTVLAWGDNRYGQASVPTNLTHATSIAVRGNSSAALRRDGTILTWGTTPMSPTNLANVAAISVGNDHCLALKTDGSVGAWGGGSYHQAVVPTELTNVVAVEAGGYHSLALKADGTIVAWGNNDYHQCSVPSNLTNAVAISAGLVHSLALKADGTVAIWGTPSNTQAGLRSVMAIAAGWYASLALKADGTVTAWGDNSYGQCNVPAALTNAVTIASTGANGVALVGDGPPFLTSPLVDRTAMGGGRVYFRATATGARPLSYQWRLNGVNLSKATNAVLDLTPVQAVHAGNYSITVSNRFGRITSSEALLTVHPLRILENPQAQPVLPGETASFSVVVEAYSPVTYQWKFNGQNLNGETNRTLTVPNVRHNQAGAYSVEISNAFGTVASAEARLSLIEVVAWGAQTNELATLSGVVALATGYDFGLALRANGTVAYWHNRYEWSIFDLWGLTNITAITAGYNAVLALRSDGTVLNWTYNGPAPTGFNNAVAISAGGFHVLALKTDGTVMAWGYNTYGQTNVPPSLTDTVAVAAGYQHSLALRANGTVVAWGNNDSGQTTVPAGLADVVAISAGYNHSLALQADGRVVAWGYNRSGQTDVPPDLTNVVAIAAGPFHNLALKADGTVTGWGQDLLGQTIVPKFLTNVVAIAAEYAYSAVLLGDGSTKLLRPLSSTNPQLTGLGLSNGVFRVAAPTDRGSRYRLEFKDALSDSVWQRLPWPPVPGDNTVKLFADPEAGSRSRFYRMGVQ